MNEERPMDEYLVRLRRLDCCAVSDALDKVGIPNRVASGLPQHSGAGKVAGRAVTVRLVAATESTTPSQGAARHLGTTAIELSGPGNVIVIEQTTGIDAGSWGGTLTLGAKVRGVAGVVADGPVRDIDEARAYGFPIFCRALTARTARGRVKEVETNRPVTIAGVKVEPGDYVIADNSGAAFVPVSDVARVLDAAEFIAGREALMAKALLSGQAITEVMGADYEHMLR
jgi:4-hydroxy-4-methyl-2-oxoglutarate aldolase